MSGNAQFESSPDPQDTPPPLISPKSPHSASSLYCQPISSSSFVLAPCDDDDWPETELPKSPKLGLKDNVGEPVLPDEITEFALELWADSEQQQPMELDQQTISHSASIPMELEHHQQQTIPMETDDNYQFSTTNNDHQPSTLVSNHDHHLQSSTSIIDHDHHQPTISDQPATIEQSSRHQPTETETTIMEVDGLVASEVRGESR